MCGEHISIMLYLWCVEEDMWNLIWMFVELHSFSFGWCQYHEQNPLSVYKPYNGLSDTSIFTTQRYTLSYQAPIFIAIQNTKALQSSYWGGWLLSKKKVYMIKVLRNQPETILASEWIKTWKPSVSHCTLRTEGSRWWEMFNRLIGICVVFKHDPTLP